MEKTINNLSLTDNDIVRVKSQLTKIIKSRHFRLAKKMKLFLSYVVQETLKGKGDKLKQYNIAVEALDFPTDFDSDTNPAVRILAGRVRERLEKYYKNEGAKDTLVMNMAKGQYSINFVEKEPTATTSSKVESKPKKSKLLYAALIFAALSFLYAIFHNEEIHITTNDTSNPIPLVDVMPFEDLSNITRGGMLTKGIRYQLLTELSQFKSIRVRDVPSVNNEETTARSAQYTIKGGLLANDDTLKMTILLQDAASSEVLWTKKVDVPTTDDGFNKLIFEGIKGVFSEITGPSSVMQFNAMKHLRDRLDKGGVSSSYECVLLFYDYDNTKDPKREVEARKCLDEYTSKGVENSTLWALHGLMMVLDWTKRKDKSDDSLYDQSLKSFQEAIRIDPNNAQAYEYFGNYHMVKERNDEAMAAYEKAIELNPSKPDIHVSIGWMKVNQGDWENGIEQINEGVAMSYQPPAWFHIPLAVDAFRREDYKESLRLAQFMHSQGDTRGIALALAPSIKLGRDDLIELFTKEYSDYRKDDLDDPLREVANVLKTPKVLAQYTETLKPILETLKQR